MEKVGKIIAAAREPYKTMFMLLAMTGMRAGEMLGLQWPDIDFEKGFLNLVSQPRELSSATQRGHHHPGTHGGTCGDPHFR